MLANALFLAAATGGAIPPMWSVIPFVLILLGIAMLPLFAHHWWESNRNRAIFAGLLSIPTAIWWVTNYGWDGLLHEWKEYCAFILLLGSLYVASGGIYIQAKLRGTARTNVTICTIGAVLANLVGTTGASMLLIRPYLKANAHRSMKSRVVTIVFFIFSVSNIGGCLTPLGDPPLFLGFLKGVPFEWTLALWKEWLLALVILLTLFWVIDAKNGRNDPAVPEDELKDGAAESTGFAIEGKQNILLLLGVVGAVLAKGIFKWDFGPQEGIMAAIAVISMLITPKIIRKKNHYTWGPIAEVAILFAGIFTVMVPVLAILSVKGAQMGLSEPWHYFWTTGGLSSFLDNAPTYVVFGQTAVAQSAIEGGTIGQLVGHPTGEPLLVAISVGAVFMGAMTYIGNGPNFMVKAIAEEAGIEMPSFFGYMKYSAPLLLPIFAIVTWIFFL